MVPPMMAGMEYLGEHEVGSSGPDSSVAGGQLQPPLEY